jgi:hypothetical protein
VNITLGEHSLKNVRPNKNYIVFHILSLTYNHIGRVKSGTNVRGGG